MSVIEADETALTEEKELILEQMTQKVDKQMKLAQTMDEELWMARRTFQRIVKETKALETSLREKTRALKEVKSRKKQVMDCWRGEIDEWIQQDVKVTKQVESLE